MLAFMSGLLIHYLASLTTVSAGKYSHSLFTKCYCQRPRQVFCCSVGIAIVGITSLQMHPCPQSQNNFLGKLDLKCSPAASVDSTLTRLHIGH